MSSRIFFSIPFFLYKYTWISLDAIATTKSTNFSNELPALIFGRVIRARKRITFEVVVVKVFSLRSQLMCNMLAARVRSLWHIANCEGRPP